MITSRYQNFIKNADYTEAVQEVTKSFTQHLELFEQSIEWDVSRFFAKPQEVLSNMIDEVKTDIEKDNNYLDQLRENPEIYQDPLTLFELKLLQYEFMNELKPQDKSREVLG